MKHIYRNDPALCYAPLLGNGDLVFPMDAEGGIGEHLPTPPGLPSAALHRLSRGRTTAYGTLKPTLLDLGHPVADPHEVSTEFSTDEGIFTSVCRYAGGAVIETRACAYHNRPFLMISKHLTGEGPLSLSYEYILPENGPFTLTAEGGMLIGNGSDLPERFAVFSDAPASSELTARGGRITILFPKNGTVTLYIAFTDSAVAGAGDLFSSLSSLQGFIYNHGEGRLFRQHASAWRTYREESELIPGNDLLARVCDGSEYLLRALGSSRGALTVGNHPIAPFSMSPTVGLHVLSALLHGGHLGEAHRILAAERALLKTAEARHTGDGGARYAYYADAEGRECLPDDERRGRILQSAAVAVSFRKYYMFTQDRAFLAKDGLPVMHSVARFLLSHVEEEGGAHLAVPDLPSLGARPERPLLSTVAVAAALLAFAEAAELLSMYPILSARARKVAEALLSGLPRHKRCYVAMAGTELPKDAPLYLSPYRVELEEESIRRATVLAGVEAETLAPKSPYRKALLALSYATRQLSALPTLMQLASTADAFGFLSPADAEGLCEMPALFLDALYRTGVACHVDGTLYIGLGLTPGFSLDCDFRLPLPIGATAEGRVRDGRIVSLRVSRKAGTKLSTVQIAMPKWLYSDGAVSAVKKTERGGMTYIHAVVH